MSVYVVTLLNGKQYTYGDKDKELCWKGYNNIGNQENLKEYRISDILNNYKGITYTRGKAYDKYLYFMKNNDRVEYERQEHIISPYVLGVLLAEGALGEVSKRNSLSIASSEKDIVERMMMGAGLHSYTYNGKYSYQFPQYKNPNVGVIKQEIIRMGIDELAKDKFIPIEYLKDSSRNRIELLKGLVDTDGTLAIKKNQKNYHIMYSTTSNKLAKDVEELVTELGYGVNTTYRKIDKENHNDFWEVRIYTPDIIWSSKKNFKKIVGKEYRSNQHLCSAIKNIEKI